MQANIQANIVGIRPFWAAFLAFYAALVIVTRIYPILSLSIPPSPDAIVKAAIHFSVMYGLFGFVVRKPIRHVALRVFFIIIAAILCATAALSLYVVWPSALTEFRVAPWDSAWLFLVMLLDAPVLFLAAFALGQYAIQSRSYLPA
jgi:hypothetical protein